jgi:hypothetical protein
VTDAIQQSDRSSAPADETLNVERRERWHGSSAKKADGFAAAGMSNDPAGEDIEPPPEEFDDALWRLASALLDVTEGSAYAHDAAHEERRPSEGHLSVPAASLRKTTTKIVGLSRSV